MAYFRRTRRLAWLNVVSEEKMLEHEIRKSAVDQIMGEFLGYGKKKNWGTLVSEMSSCIG